ncbi:hypothetical protein EST38_g7710 [Candolleomyces aberdarensis]|uniref:Fungal-type protein kinase domain-containing protein n=1 Tax=Candolleomyces aberdarensis TaxID=2316362 RepID=A0A4Q2DEH7_9AGAR|nr:hypothetical protein EST38_g7710 [Candolleomyces aberdarensis]
MHSLYVASFAESDTPHGHTTQSGARLAKDRAAQQKLIHSELKPHVFQAKESFAKEVYAKIAKEEEINKYLAKSKYYSKKEKRWRLPRAEPEKKVKESDLYKPFGYIFNDIIAHFYNKAGKEITRAVVLTHKKKLFHTEDGEPTLFSQPDFTVTATGPAFKNPAKNLTKGNYDCAAGLMDAKLDEGIRHEQDLKQLAVYARQIFSHQPQRRFVRILIITEQRARLYHFDRSGAQFSPLFDFHNDPYTFVRLVLGVSSVDEETLGFDTSVYWGKNKHGKPIRYIKVVVEEGKKKKVDVYQLIPGQEPFTRKSIRGRGTTGWYALKGNQRFLIKDSWRSAHRTPEYEFLEAAKGIDGIGQMVSYVEGPHTREYRGSAVDSYALFRDRVFCRIVMDLYGGSLDTFETVEQALAAVRDAIAGHRALLLNGVLHRDVSLHNILLGLVETLGKRGLLIDLDMAKFIGNGGANALTDFRTGTRMFQSLMVLESFTLGEYAPDHDHLDDLESFVYVLAYLLWTFEKPGIQKPSPPKWMEKWGHDDPEAAHSAKSAVMLAERELHEDYTDDITDFWGEPCRVLMFRLHKIISSIAVKKRQIARVAKRRSHTGDYKSLRYNKDGTHKHYDEILQLLDDAIEGVRAEAAKAQADDAEGEFEEEFVASPPTASSEAPSDDQEREVSRELTPLHLIGNVSRSHVNKRTSTDQVDSDELPPLKRLRTLSGSAAVPVLDEDEENSEGEEQGEEEEEVVVA